jgi:hypothetical protein
VEGLTHGEWIGAAGFLFERRRGIAPFKYADDLIALARLEDADVDEVASEICRLLESGELESEGRASAYWALGKIGDGRLLAIVQGRLALELVDIRVAIQAMYAPSIWGEPVFSPERSGISAIDDELNRRDAEAYLLRLR